MISWIRYILLFLLLFDKVFASAETPYRLVSTTPILQALELKHYELPNGLQVAIVEDDTRPIVICQINYRVGSADEPPKRQGLAHLVEHLLHDPVFVDELNLQAGRHSNASTSRDGTRYYTTIPKQLLTQVLKHFAKNMVALDVTPETFDIEKSVVLAEADSRLNNVSRLMFHQMNKHVFSGHPYEYDVLGTHRDSIKNFTLEGAQQFHQRYYVPNNACLVVVGDVRAAKVMRDVVRLFGDMPPGKSNGRKDVFTPTFTRVTTDTVFSQESARGSTWWTVWPMPSAIHPDRVPLSLLMKVLYSGGSSPMDQALRNTHLVLSSQHSFSVRKEAGFFYHKAALAPQVTQEAVTFSINKVIRNVVDSLSDDRMHIVRNYARKDLYAMITSQPSLAGVIGYSFIRTNDPTHRLRWMQALDQVSKDDIQRVAKTYLIDQQPRQFVLEKRVVSSSVFDRTSTKILLIVALVVLVFLVLRYNKNKHIWESLGIFLFVFSSAAHAEIPNHKIYYEHDPRVPQTEISLIYATGGNRHEPEDKKGMLFALEGLLYDQIRKEISPHFDRLGAYVSFRVSDLDATIKIKVFSEHLDETLLLVHDFIEDVQFDGRELNLRREMITKKFANYVDGNSLAGVLRDRLFERAENRRIGTRQGIAKATAEDLNTFVQKTRRARVLYFKVISDLSEKDIQQSLKIFTTNRLQDGFWPHPKPKRKEIYGRQFVIVPIARSKVDYCYGISNALPRQDKLWFAQMLMIDALEDYFFYKLREEHGWCYSAGARLNTRFFPPVIQFYANPSKVHTKHLVPEMYRLIREFSQDPEFWTRLEKSRARLKQAYALKYGLGHILNQKIEFDRDGIWPLPVVDYDHEIDHVTREDIDRVIQKVLNLSGFNTGGLQMVFFGEKKHLKSILNSEMPDRSVGIFEPERLLDEVNTR